MCVYYESGALNFIPILDITKKISEGSNHLFKMISAYIKNQHISSFMGSKREGMSSFRVEGINVFKNLLPLFVKYSHFWYFKTD